MLTCNPIQSIHIDQLVPAPSFSHLSARSSVAAGFVWLTESTSAEFMPRAAESTSLSFIETVNISISSQHNFLTSGFGLSARAPVLYSCFYFFISFSSIHQGELRLNLLVCPGFRLASRSSLVHQANVCEDIGSVENSIDATTTAIFAR